MKVFISYGAEGDQVTALRLQALAAVHGHSVYVPPAYTRQGAVATVDPDVGWKLKDAEVVLGVIGEGLTAACRQELSASVALRKNMIVMAYPWFVPELKPHFGHVLVEIDPENPGAAEGGIVHHLKSIELQRNAKNVLLALGTLTLGLLILSPTDQN